MEDRVKMKKLIFVAVTVSVAVWNALNAAEISELDYNSQMIISAMAGVLVMLQGARHRSTNKPVTDRRYCHVYPYDNPDKIIAKRCKGVLYPDGVWVAYPPKGYIEATKQEVSAAEERIKEAIKTTGDVVQEKVDSHFSKMRKSIDGFKESTDVYMDYLKKTV